MRTAFLPLLYATLLQFATAAAAAPDFDYTAAAREPSLEILSSLRTLRESARLRGDFSQRKDLRILRQPFISRGWFIYSRQNGIYWEIASPLPGAYLIGKKGIRPAGGGSPVPESPFANGIGRIFSSIIGVDLEELRTHFDMYYRNPDAGWQLGLKPRNRHIAGLISSIEITGNRYIDAIKIRETGGDITEIVFTSVSEELHPELEARYFNESE